MALIPGPSFMFPNCGTVTSNESVPPTSASNMLSSRDFWVRLSNMMEAFGKAGLADSSVVDEDELMECQAVVNQVVESYDLQDGLGRDQQNVQEESIEQGYGLNTPPASPCQSYDYGPPSTTLSAFNELFLDAEGLIKLADDNLETCSNISGISDVLKTSEADLDLTELMGDCFDEHQESEEEDACSENQGKSVDERSEDQEKSGNERSEDQGKSVDERDGSDMEMEDSRVSNHETVQRIAQHRDEEAHTCTMPFRQRKSLGAGLKKLPVQRRKEKKGRERNSVQEKERSESPQRDNSRRYYLRVRKPAPVVVQQSLENLPEKSRPLDLSKYNLKRLYVRLVRLDISVPCSTSLYATRYCRNSDEEVNSIYGKIRVCETSPLSIAKSWNRKTVSTGLKQPEPSKTSKKVKRNLKDKLKPVASKKSNSARTDAEVRIAVQRSPCSRYNFRKLEIVVSKADKMSNQSRKILVVKSPKEISPVPMKSAVALSGPVVPKTVVPLAKPVVPKTVVALVKPVVPKTTAALPKPVVSKTVVALPKPVVAKTAVALAKPVVPKAAVALPKPGVPKIVVSLVEFVQDEPIRDEPISYESVHDEPEVLESTNFPVLIPEATSPFKKRSLQKEEDIAAAVRLALHEESDVIDEPETIRKKALRLQKVVKAMENPYTREDGALGEKRKLVRFSLIGQAVFKSLKTVVDSLQFHQYACQSQFPYPPESELEATGWNLLNGGLISHPPPLIFTNGAWRVNLRNGQS